MMNSVDMVGLEKSISADIEDLRSLNIIIPLMPEQPSKRWMDRGLKTQELLCSSKVKDDLWDIAKIKRDIENQYELKGIKYSG